MAQNPNKMMEASLTMQLIDAAFGDDNLSVLDFSVDCVPQDQVPIARDKWSEEVELPAQFLDEDIGVPNSDEKLGSPDSPERQELQKAKAGRKTYNEAEIIALGEQRLQESLKKLQLPFNLQAHRMIVERMDCNRLAHEKKRVKEELKLYDDGFREKYGEAPNRREKEPMRPLYTYYRMVKMFLDHRSKVSGARPSPKDDNYSMICIKEPADPSRREPGVRTADASSRSDARSEVHKASTSTRAEGSRNDVSRTAGDVYRSQASGTLENEQAGNSSGSRAVMSPGKSEKSKTRASRREEQSSKEQEPSGRDKRTSNTSATNAAAQARRSDNPEKNEAPNRVQSTMEKSEFPNTRKIAAQREAQREAAGQQSAGSRMSSRSQASADPRLEPGAGQSASSQVRSTAQRKKTDQLGSGHGFLSNVYPHTDPAQKLASPTKTQSPPNTRSPYATGQAHVQNPLDLDRASNTKSSYQTSPQRSAASQRPTRSEENHRRKQREFEHHLDTLHVKRDQLLAEKNIIRERLQKYQDDFLEEHKRKIRFHKDILPIEKDYRSYKMLKEALVSTLKEIEETKQMHVAQ